MTTKPYYFKGQFSTHQYKDSCWSDQSLDLLKKILGHIETEQPTWKATKYENHRVNKKFLEKKDLIKEFQTNYIAFQTNLKLEPQIGDLELMIARDISKPFHQTENYLFLSHDNNCFEEYLEDTASWSGRRKSKKIARLFDAVYKQFPNKIFQESEMTTQKARYLMELHVEQ